MPFENRIIEFKTFVREGTENADKPVYAHLFEPLYEIKPKGLPEEEIAKPSGISEWGKEELFKFLEWRSDIQRAFLKILAEKGKIYNADLLTELKRVLGDKFGGYTSGALGGLNNSIKNMGKENLHYVEWDERDRIYKIEDKYRDIIREYFSKKE